MKKILSFLLIFVFSVSLIGCKKTNNDKEETETPTVEKYTVRFYTGETLYKTLKIEKDHTIGKSAVENPTLEGFEFVSWKDENNNEVDLDTYKVTKAVKFYATFKEVVTDDTLVVDATKEEGKTYYLVVGWWETTALNDDGTPKVTSSLTVDTVRVFYANLKLYLKAYGATDEELKQVQFRNYSSAGVAEMGEAINADGDVDLVIGVGNNINSTAKVSLFEGNDGKTTAKMGTQSLSRYVALPEHENMNKVAISIFDWIKTEIGQTAFTTQLDASKITVVPERTDDINVTVTIHGLNEDTKVTTMTSKQDTIEVPEIEVKEGFKFLGYAITADATKADVLATVGTALTFADIESLLNDTNTLELYPVIVEEIIDTDYDLVVYIHVTDKSKLSVAEADLLVLRFKESLTEEKNINFVYVTEGLAADFLAKINEDIQNGVNIDVVIGGNATTKNLTAIDDTYANATCGEKHFADGSRKVIVLSTASTSHLELAKEFYNFMVNAAPELTLHVAYWARTNWITEDEMTTITAGISTYINDLFKAENAMETYNINVTYYKTTTSNVTDLSVETKAFNDGKGVGLIIGTGANATNEENMGSAIVEQKDCPTTIVASGRKVSLCVDNFIYRAIYENYFAEQVTA